MSKEFQITDSAAARIAELAQSEEPGTRFRVSVQGGGCSGFQYDLKLDTSQTDKDIVLQKNNAEIIIDDISIGFLNESTLDYVEDLGSAGFEIKNPNVTAKCGCGNSFSI